MYVTPVTATSDSSTVTATVAQLTGMEALKYYVFASSTNCWVKQGTTQLITCVTNANMADSDFITIAVSGGTTVVYEYDKSANGVTAGRQSWAAGASTAIDVAATLATAIATAQPTLSVTNNANGTLTVTANDKIATFTENVANAGFTITSTSPLATAADGSVYIPANVVFYFDGNRGAQLGVIRDSADGKASLTRVLYI